MSQGTLYPLGSTFTYLVARSTSIWVRRYHFHHLERQARLRDDQRPCLQRRHHSLEPYCIESLVEMRTWWGKGCEGHPFMERKFAVPSSLLVTCSVYIVLNASQLFYSSRICLKCMPTNREAYSIRRHVHDNVDEVAGSVGKPPLSPLPDATQRPLLPCLTSYLLAGHQLKR